MNVRLAFKSDSDVLIDGMELARDGLILNKLVWRGEMFLSHLLCVLFE